MSEMKKAKVISPSSLNIRAVPGGDILMEASHHAIVTLLDWDSDETWAKVEIGDVTGYAMKEYLEIVTEDEIRDMAIEQQQKRAEEKESGMFANIGDKIKSVTFLICVLGMALSVILGVILMASEAVLAGILTAVLGVLLFYIGSMAMYGFGELICESKKQSAIHEEILKELRSK